MDQTGISKTGSEPWKRTIAILVVCVMVMMLAAPMVNAGEPAVTLNDDGTVLPVQPAAEQPADVAWDDSDEAAVEPALVNHTLIKEQEMLDLMQAEEPAEEAEEVPEQPTAPMAEPVPDAEHTQTATSADGVEAALDPTFLSTPAPPEPKAGIINVGVAMGGWYTPNLVNYLDSLPDVTAVGIPNVDYGTIIPYDVIIMYGNQGSYNDAAVNQYVNEGHGVIATPWILQNGHYFDALPVTNSGSGTAIFHTPLNVAVTDPADPLVAGVPFNNGDMVGYEQGSAALKAGATCPAVWNDGFPSPAVAYWEYGQGRSVYLNFHYITSDCSLAINYGWGQELIHNLVTYAAGNPYELSPEYQSEYCSFNGEQLYYPLILTNLDTNPEWFDLTASGNLWSTDMFVPDPLLQMQNPGFETGDLTAWTTADLATPYVALQVSGPGIQCPDMWDGFLTDPTEGAWSLQTGWDGDGPGHITAGQDYAVPLGGETVLMFDYRACWDLQLIPATLDRTFSVNIEPAGGGVPLQTNLMLTAPADTYETDTDILQGFVDLTPYAGTTVFINFDWWVPETNSGPAYFELDNLRVMSTYVQTTLMTESFEAAVPPTGWTLIQNNAAETWHQDNIAAVSGTFSATCYYDPVLNPQNEWLITQPLDLTDIRGTELSFWWMMSYTWAVNPSDNYDLNVYVSTDSWGTSDLLWNEDTIGPFTTWAWYDTTFGMHLDLSAYDGMTNVQIGFQYAGTDGAQLSLDDITVTGLVPFNTLGPVPAGGSVDILARVTVPGWANPGDFDTASIVASESVPDYFADFESGDGGWVASASWAPVGDWEWTNTYDVTNYVPGAYAADEIPPPTAYSGTGLWGTVMYAPYTNADGWSYLTQTFDFSGLTGAQLSWRSWEQTFGNFDYCQLTVNGDLVWGPSWDFETPTWQERVVDLSAYAGNPAVTIQFEMWATAVVNYAGWYIDDVRLTPIGAISNTAQIQTIWPHDLPWTDDLESGLPLWASSGYWHPVSDIMSPYPNSHSPFTSWWYGQDATGDYDDGARNFGRLETPPIDLTGETEAWFEFSEWYETEGGSTWDQRWVQIDTGSGWTDIMQLPDDGMYMWMHRTIDLSAYCGNIVKLGFWFDTIDDESNDFLGWYIDDAYVGHNAVDVAPEYNLDSDYWGEDVEHTITVTNTGSVPDRYDITVDWNSWPTTFWNLAGTTPITFTPIIPAGGSYSFIVRVRVANGVPTGTPDWAFITVTSWAFPQFVWDAALLETEAIDPYGVDLTPDSQISTGYVSTYVDHMMTVTNTGILADRYDLTIAGNAWPTTIRSTGGTTVITSTPLIPAGGTYNFRVRVEVPALAPPGSWDQVWVTATSWADAANTEDTVDARTYSESPYGVELTPAFQQGMGNTGEDVPYLLNIENTGAWAETFDLTATGNAWPVTFYEVTGWALLVSEQFEAPFFPPTDWNVVNYGGTGVWTRNDWVPDDRPNYAGTGFCANADSDSPYTGDVMNTGMRTPTLDLSAYSGGSLEFDMAFNSYSGNEYCQVRISTDGGSNWDVLSQYDTDISPSGPGTHIFLDISAYAGSPSVIIEFLYANANYDWYWEVDNVVVTAVSEGQVIGPITEIGPIQPGESGTILAIVSIPAGLPPDSWDTATVTATSQHYFYVADTAVLQTNGEPAFWFDVDPFVQTNFGWCPDWVEHRVSITNLGTETDWYLPMFVVGDEWWPTRFYTVDLRPDGIYNGIDTGEQTWIWGPVGPGETKEYAIKVFVPTFDAGAVNWENIEITSVGNGGFMRDVWVCTRTSLPTPFYDDFEEAGDEDEFGLYNDGGPLGDVTNAWTRDNPSLVDVSSDTAYSGWYSMYTSGGQCAATSCFINNDIPFGIASCVIQRGDDGFSEDPDTGEDLVVEYSDGQGAYMEWHVLDTFTGAGTPGQIYTPTWVLPEDALNPRFQIRFRQMDGDGEDDDYWHIDDVYVGAPQAGVDIFPVSDTIQAAAPGGMATFNVGVENLALHGDSFTISIESNDWPAWVVPEIVGPLGPNGMMPDTGFFNVYVLVPTTATQGMLDVLQVTATSVLDQSVFDSLTLTATVPTVYNIDQGNWYAKIQDAVDDAVPGDNIIAYENTYKETVTVDLPVSIFGDERDTTIVEGGFRVLSNGVGISDLTIIHGNPGVMLDTVALCSIHDITFQDCMRGVVSESSGVNQIFDNTFYGATPMQTIVINEFNTGDGDWVEFYNFGPAQDMTGWTWFWNDDRGFSDTYTFPAGFLFPSGGFVHLIESGDPSSNTADTLYIGDNMMWDSSATGVAGEIRDDFGQGVDFFKTGVDPTVPTAPNMWLGPNIPHPVAADAAYRIADLDTDSGADWGTGGANSPLALNPGQTGVVGGTAGMGLVGIESTGTGFSNVFHDDFSTDTGAWTYLNSASRTDEHMVVCPIGGSWGQGRFDTAIHTAFIADFDWRIYDGDDADGMAMMFYKDFAYAPGGGGALGFDGSIGYAIEFDQYYNAWGNEPDGDHIGLIQNVASNHLSAVIDNRVRTPEWHHAQVIVDPAAGTVQVYIDHGQTPVISWAGALDTTFGGFGFTGGTGGQHDNHWVDNVFIRWGSPAGNEIHGNMIENFETGIALDNSEANLIYHNNFMANTLHAADNLADPANAWDNGYPDGGNYWDSHTGIDMFGGPLQNIPGSDGFLDTPFAIDGDTEDRYPMRLMYTSSFIPPTKFLGIEMPAPATETVMDTVPGESSTALPAEEAAVPDNVGEEVAPSDAPEADEAPAVAEPEPITDTQATPSHDILPATQAPAAIPMAPWLGLLSLCLLATAIALALRRRK